MTPQGSQHTSPTRVMVNTTAVLFVLGMAWLLIQIQSIILLLIIGIILAAAIEPLVFRLRRHGLSRGQSIMIVYVCLLALLGLGIYALVPSLIRQVSALNEAVPTIFESLRQQALESDNAFIRRAGYRSVWNIENAYTSLRESPNIGQDQAVGVATSIIGVLFTAITVMIVAFYWMTEKATIKRVMLGLFPFGRRDRAHAIWDEIEYKIGGWTRGQLLLMVIIGVCSGAFYYVIDLRFWLALAIWAALTEAIPFIGPFIGGGTAALIALAESPETALMVVGFTIALQQLEGAVLVPRVMRNAVGMSPLTVVLAVLVGGVLIGPLGSLLAIPVGAAVQVLVQNLLRLRDDRIESELRNADRRPLTGDALNSPFLPANSATISRSTPDDPQAERRPLGHPAQ
ncbi:MAG: AI-2E family transporter [Chloroflexia bacterium]|nr:AI-2E family transporter [Chloroflexia bacterium]